MAKTPAPKKEDDTAGADAKAAAEKLIADAKEEAAKIAADAKAKADETLAEAMEAMKVAEERKDEAEKLIADAKAEAERIIEEAAKLAAEKPSEATEAAPAAPADMKGGVRIRSKVDGFRRAGVAHPKDATEYPAGAFTATQIKLLKDEPNLVVEDL